MAAQEDQEPEMEEESDEDLLIFMSMRDSDPVTAKAAWSSFYMRHNVYLYSLCRRVLYKFLSARYQYREIEDMAKELVKEVMIKVFEKAGTYRHSGSVDADFMRRRVRAWIGTVARNEVIDWLRSGKHESGSRGLDEIENTDDVVADNHEDTSKAFHDCIRKILDSLPDKERMVVYAYLQHFDVRKGSGRLPNEESKELAQSLGLTTAALRQIKVRAYRKLEEEIRLKCMDQDLDDTP